MPEKIVSLCRSLKCYTLEARECVLTLDHSESRDGLPVLVRLDDAALCRGESVRVRDIPAVGPSNAPRLYLPVTPLSKPEEHFLAAARRAGYQVFHGTDLDVDTSRKLGKAFQAQAQALDQHLARRRSGKA